MRALISVSDKNHLDELAHCLSRYGIEMVSTGGTKRYLEEKGFEVIGVSEVTGFPEILDGRVKTLHPYIHSGLLADRDQISHQEALLQFDIHPFDFVVVNLYPFKETIAKPEVTLTEAIENIDIGGPSMIRAAAKNAKHVTVLVDPLDYKQVERALAGDGQVPADWRRQLQAKAFRHTAAYDALIADYLTQELGEEAPEKLTLTYEKVHDLRYGENAHQSASLYKKPLAAEDTLVEAKQWQGKALSYNNLKDAHAALALIREFEEPTAAAIKHMNPCGVGRADDIITAFDRCYAADPVSIFGGIIAVNREVDATLAKKLTGIFLEIILAPSYTSEALTILKQKKNLRVLSIDLHGKIRHEANEYVSVSGGLLQQQSDETVVDDEVLAVVTTPSPSEAMMEQMHFGMKVVKHTRSNAIVLVNSEQTIGIGAGQMNRVGAARIACEQAKANGFDLRTAVLASDAFFPMPDTVELAASYGIAGIIQPGGSIKDQESIDAANTYGMPMVLTGQRHFKH